VTVLAAQARGDVVSLSYSWEALFPAWVIERKVSDFLSAGACGA
jgi:hypothetical protein